MLARTVLMLVALIRAAAAEEWDGQASTVLRSGDIDRDGVEDVIVLGHGPWRSHVVALRMPAFEILWRARSSTPGFGINVHAVGDVNGDGHTDFAVGATYRDDWSVTVLSGANGSMLETRPGIRFAMRATVDPPTWLVAPRSEHGNQACIRIDPKADRVLACYGSPCDAERYTEGWSAAVVPDGERTHVVIGFGDGAWMFSLAGELEYSFSRLEGFDGLGWSCTTPALARPGGPAHVVVSRMHRWCDVLDPRTKTITRRIQGQVRGALDAFASSVDAYDEPGATEPTVAVGAAEVVGETFDVGYVTLARPRPAEPLVLLGNGEHGFHACFIDDLDGDGTRELFAISINPTFEKGRMKSQSSDLFVCDGRTGATLRTGRLEFAPSAKAR